jgi:hypothetical protein
MALYKYATAPHRRRHGPAGYTKYGKFRSWLRDEFTFRCVYCLRRERWLGGPRLFQIDHITPQSEDFSRICDYENLLYACATCNWFKRAMKVPDPCRIAFGTCLRVDRDGTIHSLNANGRRLIRVLRLDTVEAVEFRKLVIDSIRLCRRAGDMDLLIRWLGYPTNLPDLSKETPATNSRPEGVRRCYFERRRRGQLPELY